MQIVTCWWSIVKSALELTRDEFLDDIMCVEQVTLHSVCRDVLSLELLRVESRVESWYCALKLPLFDRDGPHTHVVDQFSHIQRSVRNVLLLDTCIYQFLFYCHNLIENQQQLNLPNYILFWVPVTIFHLQVGTKSYLVSNFAIWYKVP